MLIVAFPASAALTPNSTIEEVMKEQKHPGFYLEFRYTTEYLWAWDNPDDRFLGRKNYWALYYLGFEKPASIKSELFPLEEYDYRRCPTPPNRLRIHLKMALSYIILGEIQDFLYTMDLAEYSILIPHSLLIALCIPTQLSALQFDL
jgi:hypothetical protein